MKTNILKFTAIILLFTIVLSFGTSYVCAGSVDSIQEPSGGTVHSGLKTRGSKVWNTAKLVLQVAAVGIFIYTGIKYMYASADQKADLKKGLLMTFLGVALVFGLTYVVDFVQNIASDLM